MTLFKKWCREVHNWVRWAWLSWKKAICVTGKYLDGRAYQFYEWNVLDLRKQYSLTEFFEDLFDYVFLADFRIQQHDKVDTCKQDGRPVLDFLLRLQKIADTIGDVSECNVALVFWRHCQPYLQAELTRNGYDMTAISVVTLESECLRYEKAHWIIQEDRNQQYPDNMNKHQQCKQCNGNNSAGTSSAAVTPTVTAKPTGKEATINSSNNHNQAFGDNKQCDTDKERRKRLRGERKCFTCEGTNHIEHNCPQQQKCK